MAIILEPRRRLVLPKFGTGLTVQFRQSSIYLYDLINICWYESVLEMLPLIFLMHLDCFNSIMGYLGWILGFGSLLFVRHIISWLTYTREPIYAAREKYRIVKNVWLTIFFALITLQIFNSAARDFLLMAVVAYGFYTITDFTDVADKFIVDIDPDRGARDIKYVVSETLLRILSKLTVLGGVIAFFYIREAEIALRVMFGSFLLSKHFLLGILVISQVEPLEESPNVLQSKQIILLFTSWVLDMISLGFLVSDPEDFLIVSTSFKGAATCFMVLSSFIHDHSLYFKECKAKQDSIIKILSSK
jgi:hypothetical protein